MKDRLSKIFLEIGKCKVFADVGCDHGIIAKKMLDENMCDKVIISDVSEKCLDKARKLLSEYIICDRAESFVSDGFTNLPTCDTALIAGMGGEEIISILNSAPYLPKRLILQPMKNADKVRVLVVSKGYKIIKDFVFRSEYKFYDLIVLEKGVDKLSEDEIIFGRTNIIERSDDFKTMILSELDKFTNVLERAEKNSRKEIIKKIERLEKYVKD